MQLIIREASLDDVPFLVEMGCKSVPLLYGDLLKNDPIAQAKLAIQLITLPFGVVFVSEKDANITGMIGLIATIHPTTSDAVVSEMFWYVSPNARGSGPRLLKKSEEWAKIMGAKKLIVVAPNEKVERFYVRKGFHKLETQYIKDI